MPDLAENMERTIAAHGSVVVLRAGDSEIGIAPACGGSIAWYHTSRGGRRFDWLRPAGAAALASDNPERMACFPLVPFSNRVRNGRFRFRGREVRLPLNVPGQPHAEHGHGWQAPWRLVNRSDTAATLEYRHQAGAWPFAYAARQVFRVGEDGLSVEIEVENCSSEAMPLGIGLHPYFPRTKRTRLAAHVDAMWETDDEVMPTALIAPPLRRQLTSGVAVDSEAMDNGFTGWRRRARIEWPEHNSALSLTASAPLDFFIVYTPPGESYFCAEPVSHCTDAFNLADQGRTDTGMAILAPGQVLSASVRFTPEITNDDTQQRGGF